MLLFSWSTSRHSRAAVFSHRFNFSIGGGSWHQQIEEHHNNFQCGVQMLVAGLTGVPTCARGFCSIFCSIAPLHKGDALRPCFQQSPYCLVCVRAGPGWSGNKLQLNTIQYNTLHTIRKLLFARTARKHKFGQPVCQLITIELGAVTHANLQLASINKDRIPSHVSTFTIGVSCDPPTGLPLEGIALKAIMCIS